SMAALNVRANPRGGTLNLAVLPTFSARWLAKRLPDFTASCPGVMINFVTRLNQFDFTSELLDGAIHFGAPQWPGTDFELIRSEPGAPACSPEFVCRYDFRKVVDVLRAPLLILISRPDAWERWLAAHGAPAEGVHGMMWRWLKLRQGSAGHCVP